ncbi:MAG TPA: c-type cytochrome [Candidatus Dormibacteraeota bacterium]|nr:c-type cytochrome [Candidatus Dormibacteraeota bacterium]
MFKFPKATIPLLLVVALAGAFVIADAQSYPSHYGFGTPATVAQQKAWNDDVNGLTGAGLPPGHGSVADGQNLYEAKCAVCHGDFGEGENRYPVLAGGNGTLTSARPVKTVGSYWPYAPTLYDYIRRAMPFNAPGSLTNDQVYAISAYVLNLNNLVPANAVLDAKTLAAIKMPNRNGFINEHLKPDVHAVACMTNCKKSVTITSNLARTLGITPNETGSTPDERIITGSGPSADAGSSAAPAGGSAKHVASAPVAFSQIEPIVAQRCAVCHAAHPTEAGFSSAPMGIMLDTPARIAALASRIKQQAVTSHTMPIGNMTGMTDNERALLGKWIDQGAKIH